MQQEEAYKLAKEAFVSGLEGTSMWEIAVITGVWIVSKVATMFGPLPNNLSYTTYSLDCA